MTDPLADAVTEALGGALSADRDLTEQAAAVDLTAVYNRLAAGSPGFKPMTADHLLALGRGEQVASVAEIAAATNLDLDRVQAFLDGDPDEDIEIPPTALHGFDDVFGDPTDGRAS